MTFYLVSRPDADTANITPDLTWPNFRANGDDGIALAKLRSTFTPDTACPNDTETAVTFSPTGKAAENWCIIDVFGEPTDPGTGWEVAGTANATRASSALFRRKISFTSPNYDWDDSRGTTAADSEWIVVTPTTDWSNVGIDTP